MWETSKKKCAGVFVILIRLSEARSVCFAVAKIDRSTGVTVLF